MQGGQNNSRQARRGGSSTKEDKDKVQEEANKKEASITTLREAVQKKRSWYKEQLAHEHEKTDHVKVRLIEELHEKESQMWVQMKSHYKERTTANKRKLRI